MKEKKLMRSSDDRVLAGVAGGLAEHFEIDPVLVRVLFVIFTLLSAVWLGLLVYIILWVVMPEQATDEA